MFEILVRIDILYSPLQNLRCTKGERGLLAHAHRGNLGLKNEKLPCKIADCLLIDEQLLFLSSDDDDIIQRPASLPRMHMRRSIT